MKPKFIHLSNASPDQVANHFREKDFRWLQQFLEAWVALLEADDEFGDALILDDPASVAAFYYNRERKPLEYWCPEQHYQDDFPYAFAKAFMNSASDNPFEWMPIDQDLKEAWAKKAIILTERESKRQMDAQMIRLPENVTIKTLAYQLGYHLGYEKTTQLIDDLILEMKRLGNELIVKAKNQEKADDENLRRLLGDDDTTVQS